MLGQPDEPFPSLLQSAEDERRRKAEAEWLWKASFNDKWEWPPPLYDPDDPGLLSDEMQRNYGE